MINAAFFTHNRTQLEQECADTEVFVLGANTAMQSVADTAAHFRQESNFWYLTGIEEPDWMLVLSQGKSWLIAPDVSESHRIFEGGISMQAAQARSGVDAVLNAAEAEELFARLSRQTSMVGLLGEDPHASHYTFSLNPARQALWDRLSGQFSAVKDVRPVLVRLRALKQPSEIEAIEQAVALTAQTFQAAKQKLNQLSYEYELEAEFTAAFRRQNAQHAYEPIVAGGINACTLHYVQNSGAFTPSSLVLIDIGARLNGYCADITRTYITQAATARQVEVHQAVQRAQQATIGLLKPGLSFQEYQAKSDKNMEEALRSLGLLTKPENYRRYFPHAMSHGLGIDVHDSLGGYGEFKPGMVLTVEPGIYIPEEKIGVRLEDNILITETGSRNLSETLPLGM